MRSKKVLFSRSVLYATGVQTTTGTADGVVVTIEKDAPTLRVIDESDWQFPTTAQENAS